MHKCINAIVALQTKLLLGTLQKFELMHIIIALISILYVSCPTQCDITTNIFGVDTKFECSCVTLSASRVLSTRSSETIIWTLSIKGNVSQVCKYSQSKSSRLNVQNQWTRRDHKGCVFLPK